MTSLQLYYQNTRGLRSKTRDVFLSTLNDHHDVVCFTETWLREGVISSELFRENFWVFRRDGDVDTSHKLDGGGSLIAVKKSSFKISPIHQFEWQSGELEDVWVTLNSGNVKVHICCVYIELHCNPEKFKKFLNLVEKARTDNHDDCFILVGDFNLPTYIVPSGLNNSSSNETLLTNTLNYCGFNQYNNIVNHNNRILDLVFSNLQIEVSNANLPLQIRIDKNHPPLSLEFNLRCF